MRCTRVCYAPRTCPEPKEPIKSKCRSALSEVRQPVGSPHSEVRRESRPTVLGLFCLPEMQDNAEYHLTSMGSSPVEGQKHPVSANSLKSFFGSEFR